MDLNIGNIRKEYSRKKLNPADILDDPVLQFEKWLQEAVDGRVPEPTAMCLSTVNTTGVPSSRMVLLKGIVKGRFLFYTNYTSQKSLELQENNNCSVTFFWAELERQVNITGTAIKVDEKTSDEYFATRPYPSQVGAWVSPQSKPISSKTTILKDFIRYSLKFAGKKVPRPPFWGGWAIEPVFISFWQGRPSRLHDRIQYSKVDGGWKKERMAP